ncbi:MAG: porin [Flavobacteriaceae bacterium]|nr:porin [Flavobacteriaceae bacterium]MDG1962734.1 porin [Flavobacteriaceae bacterium]
MRLQTTWLLGLSFLCFLPIHAQTLNDQSFGKGLINFTAADSSFTVKFAPRIQTRFQSAWNHDGSNYGDAEYNFLVRRARFKFDGWAFSPKLKYKLELGLSNRDISGASVYNRNTPRYILDAVVMWHFAPGFELWAGQTKLPGNIERVISSGSLQLIDRSILNSKFNIDRDMGIQLRYKHKIGQMLVREKLALSQGEGRNITEGNLGGLQYTSRVELLPFGNFAKKGDYSQSDLVRESSVKLMIAATYDLNQNAVKNRSNMGSYMILDDGSLFETDITTIFMDAMLKYRGFSIMAEYADRSAAEPTPFAGSSNVVQVGNATNIQASYLFKNNFELTGRHSSISYGAVTGKGNEVVYTAGASKYVVGHKLKIQSDLSFGQVDGNEDFIEFRLGFDLHF